MSPITFRNSKIVYYGPHTCPNCGVLIVKMGTEFGGTAFTNPEGPIYPNTEWHPHVCDPALVRTRKGLSAQSRVLIDFPQASALKIGHMGYVILGESLSQNPVSVSVLCVSMNQSFYGTPESAWTGVVERIEKGYPSWHIDLSKYDSNSAFGDDLDRLPECPEP